MKIKKALLITFLIAIIFRLWGINFGLPYYFHNDESEIVEPVLTAAFNIKSIFLEGDIKLLKPTSYVYGTSINYTLIPIITIIKKGAILLGANLDKANFYLFARISIALLTTLMILFVSKSTKEIFDNKKTALISAILIALNWKIIVFSHFVNSDIFLTFLTTGFYFFSIKYLQTSKNKFVLWSGIFFGLAVGTKITSLIAAPAALYMFYSKKNFKALVLFGITAITAFVISNPFSILDFSGYSNRVISMFTKEAGTVLSSANDSIFRYIGSINYLSTTLVFLLFLLGYKFQYGKNKPINIFLGLNILLYVVFFTLGSERRTDRWMLPILPIVLIYAAHAINTILGFKKGSMKKPIIAIVFMLYLYFPITLLFQFKREIPKYNAYVWAKENVGENESILVITETGNSPFNDLENAEVFNPNMYESKKGHEELPPSVIGYNYVITASKPMDVHHNKYIKKKYPEYFQNWNNLEKTLNNTNVFEPVKKFGLKGKNIITLSEMSIYKNTLQKSVQSLP